MRADPSLPVAISTSPTLTATTPVAAPLSAFSPEAFDDFTMIVVAAAFLASGVMAPDGARIAAVLLGLYAGAMTITSTGKPMGI